MNPTISHVDANQAAFARDHGFSPGSEFGWHATPDLWVSESGCVRIYPFTRFGETEWVRAVYYRVDDNVPFKHETYKHFKTAIAVSG